MASPLDTAPSAVRSHGRRVAGDGMTISPLDTKLSELSDIQREAAEWDDGPLLVLAGPGSDKTRVLAYRIARILERSPKESFRILALTSTNKAAQAINSRVDGLASRLARRSCIDTFQGFCTQVLRVHGAHLGIKSGFAVYSQTSDRRAVLQDAIRRYLDDSDHSDDRVLPRSGMLTLIDMLKTRLVSPEQAESWLAEVNAAPPETARSVARVYRLYEDELRRANALDCNSLVFEACKLFDYPGIVRHYQIVYRYWMIDEFQNTNWAQYQLLRRMAVDDFSRVFAVADDDQTIGTRNGAVARRIGALVEDFGCKIVQLPTDSGCPPQIVETANRLNVYNARRHGSGHPAEPAPRHPATLGQQIRYREFETDDHEAVGIAAEIARQDTASHGRTLVLARTRALLESTAEALTAQSVPTKILTPRDDFASPQMQWLVACLKQIHRPLDQHNMATLAKTFNSFAAEPLDLAGLESRAAVEGTAYLTVWADTARAVGLSAPDAALIDTISDLDSGGMTPDTAIQRILEIFQTTYGENEDLEDDLNAWRRLSNEIRSSLGAAPLGVDTSHEPAPLDRFLQELDLRSREPAPPPGAVSLATIHSAESLESDTVYLIGLAEEVLPSWHSINKGNGGAALEEERRSCFVAITRAEKQLILSWAKQYRGRPTQRSRFLTEMLGPDDGAGDASHAERPS